MTDVVTSHRSVRVRAPRRPPSGSVYQAQSIPDEGEPVRRVTIGLAVLLAANLLLLTCSDMVVVRVAVAAAMLAVPGWLLLRWCGYRLQNTVASSTVVACVSATLLMLVGLAVNTVGPLVGISRPLDRYPLLAGFDIVLVILVIGGLRRPGKRFAFPTWHDCRIVLTCLAPPLVAVGGAMQLNNGASGAMAGVACLMAGAVLVAGLIYAERLGDGQVGLLLLSATAALVLSFSMRGMHPFGYDIQQEIGTFSHMHIGGRWLPASTDSADDAYRAMLSITILPQTFIAICGLSTDSVFRVLLPLAVVVIPLTVFALVRVRMPRRSALWVAVIPALSQQLASQLPAVTRQAVALAMFGALLAVLFDGGVAKWPKWATAVVLSTGLVLSHYTTSYIAVILIGTTWTATAMVRLVLRSRRAAPKAISLGVVVWLIASCVVWNVFVTNSVTNVRQVASNSAGNGLQILPSDGGSSLVNRWLKAPVGSTVSADEYSELVAKQYEQMYPWMQHYHERLVAADPLTDAAIPSEPGAVPLLQPTIDTGTLLVSQLLLLAIVVSAVMFAWSFRRTRAASIELPVMVFAALLLTAVVRVSGTAMVSYNADRLYLQTMMIFAVALAFGLARWTAAGKRWLGLRHAVLAAAVAVMFLSTTHVAVLVAGGSAPVNLTDSGETAERYLYTDTDVAAARWVDRNAPQGALVFVDRYAVLPMWNSTNRTRSTFTTLAPSAVDVRGYVVFMHTNILDGRARGLIGRSFGMYRSPVGFYERNKNLIYSTNETKVYR